MKNLPLIILVLVVVGAIGLLAISKSGNPSLANGGAVVSGILPGSLTISPASFEFGDISMARGKVKTIFALKNVSSSSIEISSIVTSCMCTEASLLLGNERLGPFGMPGHGIVPRVNRSIAPGEEASIEAIFDPAAHGPAGVGNIERVVSVETASGVLEARISATVTP